MKKILLYTFIIILLIPSISSAQDSYTLLEPLPCIDGVDAVCDKGLVKDIQLDTYINYIFKFSIALAAFLSVIMIIWGGFEYMLSEALPLKLEGKARIYNAITGLLMVLASYLILRTIDPRLVLIDSSIPQLSLPVQDMEKYYESLVLNLDSYTNETQRKINAMVEKNRENLTKIVALEQKGTQRTEEENLELARLKGEVSENNVTIYSDLATEIGYIDYQKAIDILMNESRTDEDLMNLTLYYDPRAKVVPNTRYTRDQVIDREGKPTGKKAGDLPTDTPNVLQNSFNAQINRIVKIDPQKAQMLEKQRDLYIDLIKDEYESTTWIYDTRSLRGLLIEAGAKLKEENIIKVTKETGIDADIYKKIIQNRINRINKALNKI